MTQLPVFRVAALLGLLAGASAAQAQQHFDVTPCALMSAQGKAGGRLLLGQSRAQAMAALGAPTKQAKVYFEIDADTAVVFYYRSNMLYFVKDKLTSFELSDNTLAFGKAPEQAFRVGAVLTAPAGQAAASAYLLNNAPLENLKVDAEPGESADYQYNVLASSPIKYGANNADGIFEMFFDKKNKLFHISLRDI